VWGTDGDDNIVWGTGGHDNIVWGTALSGEPVTLASYLDSLFDYYYSLYCSALRYYSDGDFFLHTEQLRVWLTNWVAPAIARSTITTVGSL
jgi:hypothetical protein